MFCFLLLSFDNLTFFQDIAKKISGFYKSAQRGDLAKLQAIQDAIQQISAPLSLVISQEWPLTDLYIYPMKWLVFKQQSLHDAIEFLFAVHNMEILVTTKPHFTIRKLGQQSSFLLFCFWSFWMRKKKDQERESASVLPMIPSAFNANATFLKQLSSTIYNPIAFDVTELHQLTLNKWLS